MQFLAFNALFLTSSIGICFAATNTYDGKPGCKTPGEIGQNYRHFWDPVRYWRCIGLNIEPQLGNCPDGTGFEQSLSRCVSWTLWRWEAPQYPPSCPDGVMCLASDGMPALPSELMRPAIQAPMLPHLGQSQSLQSSPAISSPLRPLDSAAYYLPAFEPVRPMSASQAALKYPTSVQV